MRKFALVSVIALLFTATFANAQCFGDGTCYFYGGDLDPGNPNANGLANENDAIVGGNPYGAATYQSFVGNREGLLVTGLFTNNLSGLSPATGYWEIRTGVSEGNGGALLASGTAALAQVPTGRSAFGLTEYQDSVRTNVFLGDDTYWFAVVPNDPDNANRSFNSNTFGLNAVGTQIKNDQFFNSASLGANFTNANNEGVFPTFSSGVLIFQPEPSTIITFGSGLIAVAGEFRRRLGR